MMFRTHLAATVLAVLLFFPYVANKSIFALTALAASFLPDIDSAFSTAGHSKIGAVVQFFARHRGFFHSFTFCIIASVLLAFFVPVLSFGFFLAYVLHLLSDSLTIEGIKPFWPLQPNSAWIIKTGSLKETSFFALLLVADTLLFVFLLGKYVF